MLRTSGNFASASAISGGGIVSPLYGAMILYRGYTAPYLRRFAWCQAAYLYISARFFGSAGNQGSSRPLDAARYWRIAAVSHTIRPSSTIAGTYP